ncbi:hypothetical protein Tco_0404622 [Tanacetum coccineum]
MKALKESRKSNRRQPGTRGSNKGTGSKLGVLDESTVVSATSSEGTGVKPGVPDSGHDNDDNDEVKKDDKDDDADDEGDTHVSDTHDEDDKDDETESDEDEIYNYKICVRTDEDERMSDAEVVGSEKGDEEVSDAAKADAEKSFGDQFLKTYSDTSFIGTVKDSTDAEINSLMDIKIQYEVPQIQSPTILRVPVFVIAELSVLTLIPETPTAITVTTSPPPSISTIPPVHLQQQSTTPIPTPPITTDAPTITNVVHELDALNVVQLRVVNLEKDVYELKKIDISAEAFAALKTYVPTVVDNYLGSKVGDVFQKELQKYTTDLIQKYSLTQALESSKIKTPTINLEKESEKSPLEILKIKKEQAKKQQMPQFTIKSTDKAVLKEFDLKSALYQHIHANKYFNRNPANHRLYHDLMKALIEDKNAMGKGVANTVKDHNRKHDGDEDDDGKDPPAGPNQGKTASKGSKTGKSASAKEPVEELIAEVVMDDVGDNVVHDEGHAYNLLKGTCSSNVELEYHFQVCFNALTYRLDWNNPEGDYYPFDLFKPLPLQGHPEKILGLKSVSVQKLHGYSYLEEIVVKRANREFYTFKEGDFVDLHLNDIKDMLLLVVQHKLFHLTNSDMVDFIVALYLTQHKRVMRADELYKFSDRTLKKFRDELHHRIRDFHLEYNTEMPIRKWTTIDRKKSKLMV